MHALPYLYLSDVAAEMDNCGYPGEPANGKTSVSSDEFNIGDVINMQCDPGYQLQGSSDRTCEANGDWSGDPPECISKYDSCLVMNRVKKRTL